MQDLFDPLGVFKKRDSRQLPETLAAEEEKEASREKDTYKSLACVVRDYGYPIEKHFIKTQDNYINCAFRISGPRYTNAEQNMRSGGP